jgi:hypothetical protein
MISPIRFIYKQYDILINQPKINKINISETYISVYDLDLKKNLNFKTSNYDLNSIFAMYFNNAKCIEKLFICLIIKNLKRWKIIIEYFKTGKLIKN